MKKVSIFLLTLIVLSYVVSPLSWGASRSTRTTYGFSQLDPKLQIIPDTPTDIATETTEIFQITLTNYTASPVTVTVTDKQSSPVDLIKDIPLGANSHAVIAYPEGVTMTGGITWSASAADSVSASVKAWGL